MPRFLLFSVPLLLSGTALATPAAAQTYAAPTRTDADRLADAVRRVGASPRDLSALVEAGELSIKVGDATAAAAFFKRAEQVDPNNGRVKAGIARILVAGEHPGEALRYFDQASRTGMSMTPYAGDRGLAYDLTGEQERAQRDYRMALKAGDDDEIRRRYALSLGIAGRRDEALKEIDALLRRSDRGAWRARAFILAMNGDVAGANKIATSMMPGMASGLSAFFQRLPALSAADRAFAVHFGEVSPTPARLADARLAPPLAPLGTDPDAPRATQVAAVATPVAQPAETRGNSRRDRRRGRDDRRAVTASTVTAAPVVAGRSVPTGGIAPTPVATAPVGASLSGTTPPVRTAATATQTTSAAVSPARSPAVATPSQITLAANATSARTPLATAAIPAATTPLAGTPSPTTVARPAASVVASTPATATSLPPTSSATQLPPTQVASATPIPGVVPAVTTAALRPSPSTASTAPAAVRPMVRPANATPTPPRGDADEILARIVANIRIPESELAAPSRATPGSAATLDRAARKAERNVAALRGTERNVAAAVEDTAPAKPTAAERRAKAAADRKARQEAAEKKAIADKAAAEKKAQADKAAAEKKAARAEPARYWVQVAGGANQGDLGRAWSDAQKKAPALAGKSAYSTPLRATNRVVTGPFKSEAEARAMVNTLAKQGLSAFTFASTAGQKMTRLGGK